MVNKSFRIFVLVVGLLGWGIPDRLCAQNPIATENALTGNLQSEWDVSGVGDTSIQGFATDISVNRGSTISFKVNTNATAYRIDIYRLGYYAGRGARKVATVNPSVTLPQNQPAYLRDAATGLVDCGNWAVSASWAVPSTAVSGVYIARLVRTDTGGASHIVFIVRDDSGQSDMLFQTSDTTWHAYNLFGGANFYGGNGPAGRCYKVSYNRPFMNRDPSGLNTGAVEGFLWDSEYPMIRWIEANGYNVSYASGVDTDRRGTAALTQHRIFLSVGHDEYWSKQQRANIEAARAAGIHLAFFSANEMYWKTRWENSIAGTSTAYRTLVCYKETWANAKIDPSSEWTGTWRDPRFSPPYDGGRPENAVTGTMYFVDAFRNDSMLVSSAEGKLRFWRNTGIDTLADGQTARLPAGVLGFEWDETPDNGFQPPGQIRMSTTTMGVARYSILYGQTAVPGIATHHLSLYRHSSGALVFGAGTIQWSWGLDATHDLAGTPVDTRMKQATVNLFADMGVQPATLQSGLVTATQSTDFTPPTSVITMPVAGTVSAGAPVTIIGTAADSGGGRPAGVEFSLDNGATWHPAKGTANWSATWLPNGPGSVTILSRATDDSGRIETPGPGITINVVDNPAGVSLWSPNEAPMIFDQPDVPSLELGMRFQSDSGGWIKALRFYKCVANTGTHVGHLWSNTGTLLASATFSNETASGWQEVQLSTPVAITAGGIYVVSYHLDSGHYSMDPGFFAGRGFDRPPLHALADGVAGPNGVNHVGASAFPTDTYASANYWVDAVFTSSTTADTTAPSVTTISPANGATGVSTLTSVSALFDEAMAPWTVGSPNYSYPSSNPAFTFAPPTDLAHQEMLRTFKMGKDIQLTLTQVPNGIYDVYLWTFEDSNPLAATISVEGGVVGTFTSGLAGSWKRLGPFTRTISDGDIQVRFQSNDVALVSGLEVWTGGGTPQATPPSTDTFYRAINLGGPPITTDGQNWEDNRAITPDFTSNDSIDGLPGGYPGGIPGFVFNPPVDTPDHATMLRTFRYNHDVQFSLTSIPTGPYKVYVWTFEPNAPLSASLSIEQNTVLPSYSTGPAGHWDRLGPFPVNVADGNIQVQFLCTVQTDASFLSGVEVWQSSAPLPPPAGTFYRAINVGGPATVIDGHNWEGETTSNYVTNSDPNPFSLKNSQGNIIPATVTYDAASRTARLQPSSALNGLATYTATVKGGATGLSDLAGNRLPNDVAWTFSTGTGAPPQAATPTFSPAGGTYSTAQSVAISDTSSGVSIYYTTNGSTPTIASTLYTGPISVTTTTTIMAIAAGVGWIDSAVGSATYTIALGPPAAPSSLVATAVSSTQISLFWSDNASDETGFKIERKTGSGGTYSQIATVGAGVTGYSNTGLTAGATYFYRVRATNAAGDSAYSNEASAASLAAPAFRAATSKAAATGGLTINKPTGTVQGDVMAASIAVRPNTATITAPSGWTLVRRIDNADASANSLAVYYKVAGSSEPASYAWTFSTSAGAAGGIQSFSGVDMASPIDVEAGQNTASALNIIALSVITRYANDMLVTSHAFSSSATFTPPSGMTEAFDVASKTVPNSGGEAIEGDYQLQAAIGATGTRTATASGDADAGNAHTLALRGIILNTVPAAPGNLTASAFSTSQINLTWLDNASNETGFKIERKTGAGGTYAHIGTVGANVTSYSNTGLTPGTTYFYRVRTTNASGDSSYSNEASATTLPNPPVAPSGLTATTISSSQINISWTDVANENSFKIERKTGSGGTYSQIATVGAGVVAYSNTGLTPNTAYYYRVRATNAGGDSPYSNEANATTLDVAPLAPSGLAVSTVSSTQLNLSWTDSSTNETGFKIERKTGSGGTYAEVATVGAGVTAYSNTGLSAATTYFYRVRATNAVGDSAYSNEASATTLPNPPVAPSGLSATAVSSSQINISWTDVANETGYKIERKTGAGGTYAQIATVGAGVITYSDAGLTLNTTYYYRVRATNPGGDSPYSNEANGTTFNAIPAAPGGVSATAVSSSQINLSWVDNSPNETGFKIERKTGSGGTYAEIATVGASVTTFNNTGLTAATTYYYRVRATNALGDSVYSNETSAATFPDIPNGSPSLLAGTPISPNQINLSWTDNSSNETGFLLERKTGPGGTYAQIGTPAANASGYSDTTVVASTTYVYRIRATNTAGNSAYSNEATVTTPALPPPWIDGDFGSTGVAGSASYASGAFTIKASGADIWGTADAFHFVYQPLIGDGQITARVVSIQNIDPWSKAGVMIRESVAAGSKHAMMVVTPGNGVSFQRRLSTGGVSTSTTTASITAPYWVRVVRSGTTFTAYSSSNGSAWTQIGSDTISMATSVQVGLAVTSHNNASLTTAVIDNISILAQLGAPTALSATAPSSTQINLSWVDNATNETGLKIERKTGADGIYAQIGTVGANVTTYSDTGLTPGTTYFYRVRATNTSGDSSYSNEASATTLPNPPVAPSGLTATTISSSQINISWTDVANENSFKIERKTGSGGTYSQIATVGANVITYSDTGLALNTNYYYRVRATNTSGDSPYSNEANATTPDVAPAAPSGLAATAVSISQINLSWVDNATNETGFKIERKTGSGGTYAEIATVGASVTTYSNTGLTEATVYFYRVRATNAIGDSAYSNEASTTTLTNPPVAPSGLTAAAISSSQIDLAWTDNSVNETGFKIERKTSAGGTYSQIAIVAAGVVAYSNTGLTPNTAYYYRVRATNAGGDSPYSNEANATTLDVAPAAPSGLAATAFSSSQVNLSWTDNATNETGFKIERKTGSGGTYAEIATVGASVTAYSDTGLTATTTYFYRVRATNAIGDSAYSNETSATTLTPPPSAPSGLLADSISGSQINLTWTDNSSNETGFKIERKTGVSGTYSQIATVGADVVAYSNTGLAPNTAYYYRVRATNAGGDSPYSNEANATTPDVAPAAPSGLAATAVSISQINLSWVDNATNETGFKIERKTGSGGTYAEIATVGASVTTYSNTGLTEATVYFYRVRATNAIGDSAYSNEASTTTLTNPPVAPSGLTAAAISSSQIDLAWTDNSVNETGFKIERKTGAGGTYSQIAIVAAGVVAYSNTGLMPNTAYYYRVRATNAGGDSPYSNEANATTPDVAPAAPSGLAATAVSISQINLSWVDNATNETGFKIERKTGSGGTYAEIATVGASVTTYSNTGLTEATAYFYRVRATNAIGDSAYSNEASATTQISLPAAPTGLGATSISPSQINLVWTDNSSNETGFKIERKTGAGGTYAQIATVAASVTTYSDPGLTFGTTYFYRVRATNAGGDSAYSNAASATTLTTIWPPGATPEIIDQLDGVPSTEVGVRFNSDRAGWIKALRFYKAATNTGVHVGHLWTNTGTLLATVTFSNETASGWQQADLPTPIAIAASTPYVASYYSQSQHFSVDLFYFAGQGYDQAPLHALADGVAGPNGIFHDNASAFPTDGYNSSNFWVDVVFSDTP